jgi:hypothetical protein
MRKSLCVAIGLILLPAILCAADTIPILKREAGKCALAWQRQDFEGMLAYLPPRVIARSGGRAAVLRELKDQFAQARSLGVERMEALPGRAPMPRQFGSLLASIVPVTAVLHSIHLDLTQQTHVLAVSSDQGKRWFFVLLYQATQAELNAWFPEFGGRVVVPDDPAPQMDFVY